MLRRAPKDIIFGDGLLRQVVYLGLREIRRRAKLYERTLSVDSGPQIDVTMGTHSISRAHRRG